MLLYTNTRSAARRSLWERFKASQKLQGDQKHLKSTHLIIPSSLCFLNFAQKSIPGDVRAQVLQVPVGGSHADQGRKSEMPETFSDPGGQAGSNDTPYALSCMANNIFPGGVVVQIYKRIEIDQSAPLLHEKRK